MEGWEIEGEAEAILRSAGLDPGEEVRVVRVARLVRYAPSIAELAAAFETTESLAALRLGEVTGQPIALVARQVRVRGDDWAWPPEADLRRARRGPPPRGLVKVQLRERGRVVLKVNAG